ncbi:hypothetical protein ACTMSW_26685 [Micromonospora sp. BQ11]|uniref:hypothetical protein n=1 Tax=Micromonospora sp. BQ11 TaxID=3452212 RepID=UPI003F8BC45B
MNVKEWAVATGVSYATARRRHGAGALRVPSYRLGRLIMVGEPVTGAVADAGQVVVYARVPSADQEPDLDGQAAQAATWATGHRHPFARFGTEYVEAAPTAEGHRLLVVEPANRAGRAVEAATGADEPA